MSEFIIKLKSVENVAMNHDVKFQVCISKNDGCRLGRIPDRLILIFRSQNRFFGPNLVIFWIKHFVHVSIFYWMWGNILKKLTKYFLSVAAIVLLDVEGWQFGHLQTLLNHIFFIQFHFHVIAGLYNFKIPFLQKKVFF